MYGRRLHSSKRLIYDSSVYTVIDKIKTFQTNVCKRSPTCVCGPTVIRFLIQFALCLQMEQKDNNGSPVQEEIKQEDTGAVENSQENQNPGVSVIRPRQVITTAGIIVSEGQKIEVVSEEIVKSSSPVNGSPGEFDCIDIKCGVGLLFKQMIKL